MLFNCELSLLLSSLSDVGLSAFLPTVLLPFLAFFFVSPLAVVPVLTTGVTDSSKSKLARGGLKLAVSVNVNFFYKVGQQDCHVQMAIN